VQLISFERANQTNKGDVPLVFKAIVDFLASRVKPGMFQGQCSFPKIRELIASYNSGEEINLASQDLQNVCGLLKQFFRLLPEPLLTYKLYNAWLLASSDWRQCQKVLKLLPAANLAVLRYTATYVSARTCYAES
jgi:hypothetical protein